MKILVCINGIQQMDGTIYHRLYAPFKDLNELGLKIDFCADFLSQQFAELLKYDVIIVSRTITYNPYLHDKAMYLWQNMPKSTRLIVDVDDYWILPDNHPNRYWWSKHETSRCIIDTMRIATEVWTTNKSLKRKIGKIASRCEIMPNSINPSLSIDKHESNNGRIGIICNNTHEMNLPLLRNGLKTIDADKYDLYLFGTHPDRREIVNATLDITETRLKCHHIGWQHPREYHMQFYRIDVMLCPLAKNNFNQYRSRLKLEEASAYKFKVVASNYGPYANKSTNGVICVDSFDNLAEKLEELEKQEYPESIDAWKDVQQNRLDRLNYLVY
jgi:hypothetical protein